MRVAFYLMAVALIGVFWYGLWQLASAAPAVAAALAIVILAGLWVIYHDERGW